MTYRPNTWHLMFRGDAWETSDIADSILQCNTGQERRHRPLQALKVSAGAAQGDPFRSDGIGRAEITIVRG